MCIEIRTVKLFIVTLSKHTIFENQLWTLYKHMCYTFSSIVFAEWYEQACDNYRKTISIYIYIKIWYRRFWLGHGVSAFDPSGRPRDDFDYIREYVIFDMLSIRPTCPTGLS